MVLTVQYQPQPKRTNLSQHDNIVYLPLTLSVVQEGQLFQVRFQVGKDDSVAKRCYYWEEPMGPEARNHMIAGLRICLTGFLPEERQVRVYLRTNLALIMADYAPQTSRLDTLTYEEL